MWRVDVQEVEVWVFYTWSLYCNDYWKKEQWYLSLRAETWKSWTLHSANKTRNHLMLLNFQLGFHFHCWIEWMSNWPFRWLRKSLFTFITVPFSSREDSSCSRYFSAWESLHFISPPVYLLQLAASDYPLTFTGVSSPGCRHLRPVMLVLISFFLLLGIVSVFQVPLLWTTVVIGITSTIYTALVCLQTASFDYV